MVKQKILKKPPPAISPTPVSIPIWEQKHFFSTAVFFFSFLLFANSLTNGYNLDDELVTRNHRLTSKGIAGIPEIFTSAYYQDNMGYSYEYRPMVLASFALEHQFFGDSAAVGHFFNILLYSLCCLLLLKVLREMLIKYSPVIPFLVTLLFIAHSSHTEVVCSIKNRDEILSLGFGLLALYYSLKAGSGRIWPYLMIPIFFSMALLSKTTIISCAVIIPVAIIFFDNPPFKKVILITLLLLIPAYLFLNVSSGFDKFKIVSVFFLGVVSFFLLKNVRSILTDIRAVIRRALSTVHLKGGSKSDLTLDDSRNFLKGIFPDKKAFYFPYLFINVLLGLLYFSAVHNSFSLLALLPFTALFLLSWFGDEYLSWGANTVLFICLSVNVACFSHYQTFDQVPFIYKRLVVMVLVFTFFWGRKDLFFSCLFGFLLVLLINGANHVTELIVSIPVAYFLRIRRFRLLSMFLLPVFMLNDIFQDRFLTDWDKVLALMLIASLHFQKGSSEALRLVIIVCLILFHTAEYGYDKNLKQSSEYALNKGVTFVSKASDRLNPQIATQTQYRPIQYVEDCVLPSDNLSLRMGTSYEILLLYLGKTVLPYPLSFYYGYRFIKPQNITEPSSLLSITLYLLIFLFAALLISLDPLISYGLFVYLFSIIFFANYFAQIPGMMADRYLLVPSLGWCLVFVGVLYRFSNIKVEANIIEWKKINPLAKYGFSSVLLLYSVLTFSRNMDWKDDLTLFRKDIRYVSESAQANNLLALHLMQHSETETLPEKKLDLTREALGYFKRAREIYPQFFNVSFDIGRVYMQLNMPDSALISFKTAVAIDTTYPEAYRIIGDLYANNRMFEEAMPYHEKLIAFFPKDYDGYSKLSYDYFMTKKYDNSISVNKKALNSIPNRLQPLINIARVYMAVSRSDSAAQYLNEALRIDPNNREIQGLLMQVNNK